MLALGPFYDNLEGRGLNLLVLDVSRQDFALDARRVFGYWEELYASLGNPGTNHHLLLLDPAGSSNKLSPIISGGLTMYSLADLMLHIHYLAEF